MKESARLLATTAGALLVCISLYAADTVTLGKPFYMAETEITQDQYLQVMIHDYKPIFSRQAAYTACLNFTRAGRM